MIRELVYFSKPYIFFEIEPTPYFQYDMNFPSAYFTLPSVMKLIFLLFVKQFEILS